MKSRRAPRLLAGFFAVALAFGACAPMTVRSFTARGTVFSRYRTYAWAQDPARATGDPRLDNNRFFFERLRADAERELARRGLEGSAWGASDLILHYHVSVAQQLEGAAADRSYATCTACPAPTLFDAGTILFDLVDAETKALIWSGWADASIDGVIDDQDLLEAQVDRAVARIFATMSGRL